MTRNKLAKKELQPYGFSAIGIVIIIFVVIAVGLSGWYVWHKNHSKTVSNNKVTTSKTTQTKSTTTSTSTQTTNSYAGWSTYSDTGYASASGISIKYPTNWEINVTGGATVGDSANPAGQINLRSVDLSSSETPMQEWNTCAAAISADACGASQGDTTVSGNESTINGLEAYSATMQNSLGTYYVTVIKGNKPLSSTAGIPFDEFTISTSDSSVLSTYKQIMESATFPD